MARAWNEQRIALCVLLGLSAVLALVVVAIGERVAHRERVLPGVQVAGVNLGGATEPEALHRIEDLGDRLAATPIHGHAGDHALVLDPAAIGYRVDAAATVRAARRDGRSANPLDTLLGVPLRAVRDDDVDLAVHYDRGRLASIIDGWVGATGNGLVDGGLRFDGAQVAEIQPRAGVGIDRDDAERRVITALRSGQADIGAFTIGPTRPAIDTADVAEAARAARRLLAAPGADRQWRQHAHRAARRAQHRAAHPDRRLAARPARRRADAARRARRPRSQRWRPHRRMRASP